MVLPRRATGRETVSSKKMASLLPKEITALLKKIGKLSNSLGYTAFLVGGVVRDIILGVENLDLDVVVEGEAIKLGRALAAELGAAIVILGIVILTTSPKQVFRN